MLAALGLEALLKGFGVTLPSGPLAFETRTVVVCLVVGVGVTVVSAISPARRAVRIAPVAAVSDQFAPSEISLRRRFTRGGVVTLIGAVALAFGLTAPAIALVGLGAVLIFVGVALLAPALARPNGRCHRPPAGPPPRGLGAPGSRELHAKPAAHGTDRVSADGRPGPGLGHRRVRGVALELGHEQRGQRHPGRSHRVDPSQRTGRVLKIGGPHRGGRPGCDRHLGGVPGPVRGSGIAQRPHRGDRDAACRRP